MKIKPDTPASDLMLILRWYWGMSMPGMVVSIEGGVTDKDSVNPELKTIFGFALSKTVNSMNALLITDDNEDRKYITLIGEMLEGSVEFVTGESQIVGFAKWKPRKNENGVGVESCSCNSNRTSL